MRSVTLVIMLSLLSLALFTGLASANPWTVNYIGDTTWLGDNEWDLQWLVAWSASNEPPETVSFVWFDVTDDLQSADVTSWTDTAYADFITSSGVNYYIGVADDPYGVTEGDKVFLWLISDPGNQFLLLSAVVDNDPAIYSLDNVTGGIGGTELDPGDTYNEFTDLGLTPEPGSMAVLLFGLGAMGLIRRRKK